MASDTYHEPLELLSEPTRDMHRAIVSLKEELDAVDWYNQRAEATQDAELRAILVHHRDEEIEHAMMNLEWIRRRFPKFDQEIATYVGATGDITKLEASAEGDEPSEVTEPSPSLGIGSLKGA